MGSFADLGLSPDILSAVTARGYTTPTPVQEAVIPHVLMGRDVMACAQTGTGKTAGFCLPMLEILSNGRAKARMPRSLILAPTRELAAQVDENFIVYGKNTGITTALLVGGQGMEEQIKKLDRGVDVLIATPGRMLDLFERGRILLQDLKIFVIDEADRMLDMGFIPDIEKIAGVLPKIRQTLFFSATMADDMRALAAKFLLNPREVSVSPPATTATTVEQSFIRSNPLQKRGMLRALLRSNNFKSAFVFCNRKRDIAALHESLQRHGFSVAALHGDMAQSQRNEALEKFKKGEVAVLVCSDVAARGIDVKGVDAVFNFDVPFHADDYVHRIGRTGRAGETGKAFTFVSWHEDKLLQGIVALIQRDISEIRVEGFVPPVEGEAPELAQPHGRSRHGGAAEGRGRASGRVGGGAARSRHADSRPHARAAAPLQMPVIPDLEPAEASSPPPALQQQARPEPGEARRERQARPVRNRNLPPRDDGQGEPARLPKPRKVAMGQSEASWQENAATQNHPANAVVGFGDDLPAFLTRKSRNVPDRGQSAEDR